MRVVILLFFFFGSFSLSFAQCPGVYDYEGNVVETPYWISCSGGDFNLNLFSFGIWDNYSIDWGDGSVPTNGVNWQSPTPMQHLYTASIDTFVVTITEPSTGCSVQGVVVMEMATNASIQIPINGFTQACAPQNMLFLNSSTNVSETTQFSWNFGDDSQLVNFGSTNLNEIVNHVYENTGGLDCEILVSLTAQNYCNTVQGGPSVATFFPINIWALDAAQVTPSQTTLCFPETEFTFTNTTIRNCYNNGNVFPRQEKWNFGNYWGTGDSITNWQPWPPTFPQNISFPGVGDYTVTLYDSSYCGIASQSITVHVINPPTANFIASADTVCVGEQVVFTQLAAAPGQAYRWNFGVNNTWTNIGNGNATFTYNTPGSYIVRNRIYFPGQHVSCADTASVTVVVLSAPEINITANDLSNCDSLTVDFNSITVDGIAWEWNLGAQGNFTGPNPLPLFYGFPGSYIVSLTSTGVNGCSATDTEVVNVYATPVPSFTVTSPCANSNAVFTNTTTTAAGNPITQTQWTFGDGGTSNQTIPSHVYYSAGSYNIGLTVSTPYCSSSTQGNITVHPNPTASFTQDVVSGCQPLEVAFTNASQGATSFSWNFNDGTLSTNTNETHVFGNNTIYNLPYNVVLTAINEFGCTNKQSSVVTVLGGAVANFEIANNELGCSTAPAEFNNLSLGASSYAWNFGDGNTSSVEDPNHAYNNNSGFLWWYDVTLVAFSSGGCLDTATVALPIYPILDIQLPFTSLEGCSPFSAQMPAIGGVQGFDWNFGDGFTSSLIAPVHTYNNLTNTTQQFAVSLVGESAFGCLDSTTFGVTVYPEVNASFTYSDIAGCGPLEVNFQNTSINGNQFEWNFGDFGTANTASVTHTFHNINGVLNTFETELTVTSPQGCLDSASVAVQVSPSLDLQWSMPVVVGCSPFTLQTPYMPGGSAYIWNFGDGTTSINTSPTHTYVNNTLTPQQFTVTCYSENAFGCADSISFQVTVNPKAVANINTQQVSGCSPLNVTFENNSELSLSYNWNYGNGQTSATAAQSHDFLYVNNTAQPVTYAAILQANQISTCSDFDTILVTVYPSVQASFTWTGAACASVQAQFNNTSTIGTSAEWSFGDGFYSNAFNPYHLYSNNGLQDLNYNISLVSTSIFGCTDTVVHPLTVLYSPIANALIDTVYGCYPLNVDFINSSQGANAYSWQYGDALNSTISAATHTHTYFNLSNQSQTYQITLTVEAPNGCTDVWTDQVTVLPELVADADVIVSGCNPVEVVFNNQSSGATSYFWNLGNGDTSTSFNEQGTFYNPYPVDTTFVVSLTATNIYGCEVATELWVIVHPFPTAAFAATPLVQTWPNNTVNLQDNSIGTNLGYYWTLEDDSEYYVSNPGDHVFPIWGTYNIELIVNEGFCSDTTAQSITIIPPAPVALFEGNAEGCVPLTVTLNNLSQAAESYEWFFSDGGYTTSDSPIYTFYQDGVFGATLVVHGFDGTNDTLELDNLFVVHANAVASFTVSPNQVVIPDQPVLCLNVSDNASLFEWSFGDGFMSNEFSPKHFYDIEGVFSIQLIANNEFNCPDTLVLTDVVFTYGDGYLDYPNAFTPNTSGPSDGIYDPYGYSNDIFCPLHKGVVLYELQIFNKWGEQIFETNDIHRGWDGYYRGELSKEDVYLWKASVTFSNGTSKIMTGDLTLLAR